MTVGDLLDRMTSEELTEWAAYYLIDPFDSYRDDWRMATICSTLANIHAPKGRKYFPQDFIPKFHIKGEPQPAMSGDEIMNRMRRSQGAG